MDQSLLLPASVKDYVPENHVAHFVRRTVRESLDLSAILDDYREGRGYPPYHPVMMTALLLYAYCRGVYSSRRIAEACRERTDFMAVTGRQEPDHRTVSDFRKRHLKALSDIFVQVLRLCQKSGLVKLGHVALDGTKIQANASRHKAMSYGRMKEAETELAAEIRGWFERAEGIDAREDELYGDRQGDELPDWVANKRQRLAKIREAREALEREAREAAEKEAREKARRREAEGKKGRGGRPRKHLEGAPRPEAQRNFTDPESRIMKTAKGFDQCYNAQAAVEAGSHVIVAQGVTDSATDRRQLVPALEAIEANLGRLPKEISADADYCSEANLEELERREVRGYVATGKQGHNKASPTGGKGPKPGTLRHKMRLRLRRGGWRSRFRLRKQTAEPVFGQTKHARGFRQFLMRGLDRVRGEWSLVCTAHNLLKLAAAEAARA